MHMAHGDMIIEDGDFDHHHHHQWVQLDGGHRIAEHRFHGTLNLQIHQQALRQREILVGVWGATSHRPVKIDEHRVCWNLSGLIWFDRQCGKPRLTPLFMSEKRSVFFFGPLSHYMSLLPSKADGGEKSSGTSMAIVLFGPDSRTTSQDATVISSLDTVIKNQRAKGGLCIPLPECFEASQSQNTQNSSKFHKIPISFPNQPTM